MSPESQAEIRIGQYRVVRRIGRGGMGTVYEALRVDADFTQRVAIKMLSAGMDSAAAAPRFRDERRILASLEHRNIATLLDGGVTVDGLPYFVMEYIEGRPLTEWAKDRRLTLRQRIILFLQVAAAVQHAHQHLVVHCDLKPANILVTAGGTVKLLDFGIARFVSHDSADQPLSHSTGHHPELTPEYAAPEQWRGEPAAPASDVYALGMVLYELLTDRPPFDFQGMSRREIEEIVSLQVPLALSARTGRSEFRGDLDAILALALRKEPGSRYPTVARLADDLRRYLDRIPVSARPPSLGYRVGRFLRRRRIEVTISVLTLGALIAGSVVTRHQAGIAIREREQAEAVTSFFTSMLTAHNRGARGDDVTMREVLDSAASRADSLAAHPDLDVSIRQVLSSTYSSLGEFEQAITQAEGAVEAARRLTPRSPGRVATALGNLSTALELDGELERADSVLALALQLFDAEAESETLNGAEMMDHRGRLLSRLGEPAKAVTLLQQALAVQLRLAPENDSAVAYSHHNLAVNFLDLRELDSATVHFQAALALEARAFTDLHPLHASTLNNYAVLLEQRGRIAEADSAYREVLRMRKAMLGPEHPDYAWTMYNYADLLLSSGHPREAAEWARRIVALRGRTLDESHPALAAGMQVLGRSLAAVDSLEPATQWLHTSLALREAVYPADHWLLASSRSVLAEVLVRRGHFAEAERLLLPAERALTEARGDGSLPVRDARRRLVMLYTAWSEPAKAAAWQARLDSGSPPPSP